MGRRWGAAGAGNIHSLRSRLPDRRQQGLHQGSKKQRERRDGVQEAAQAVGHALLDQPSPCASAGAAARRPPSGESLQQSCIGPQLTLTHPCKHGDSPKEPQPQPGPPARRGPQVGRCVIALIHPAAIPAAAALRSAQQVLVAGRHGFSQVQAPLCTAPPAALRHRGLWRWWACGGTASTRVQQGLITWRPPGASPRAPPDVVPPGRFNRQLVELGACCTARGSNATA